MILNNVIRNLILAGLLLAGSAALAVDELQRNFSNPPDSTRPRCYWYWYDNHISKEGLTKDLEAMKRVGIGGAFIGIIGDGGSGLGQNPEPKILSDAWWSYVEHAICEAGRLGIDIGFFNTPGWSSTGGPWVKPDEAMQYATFQEMRVKGPQRFSGKLPKPQGDFFDFAVLAYPAPTGENEVATIKTQTLTQVDFEMPEPFTARSLTVERATAVDNNKQRHLAAELQVSDDDQTFRTLKSFKLDRVLAMQSLPALTARWFRLVYNAEAKSKTVTLSASARLENYQERTLRHVCGSTTPSYDFYKWDKADEPGDAALMVEPKAVRDLTKLMSADGALTWDVPAGEWIVMRAGMVPTGSKNAPAVPEATGLEVDKLRREPLKNVFDAYMGEILRRMPAAERKALKYVIIDSYERGSQNWTAGFAEIFHKRYGYDPMPFLPAMQGRIVGSVERSGRFLWDLRRLIADRMATEYVGAMRELSHKEGLKLWNENYGHGGWPAEFLQWGGQADELGGEFWLGWGLGAMECRAAASAAHIYGKPVVWSEAFTSMAQAFGNTPRDLKHRGDWAYCQGINQYMLHVYLHQPWEDKHPGLNVGFGTEFNRHNTWFEFAKPWIDYQRRCSVMLQDGVHVADVAYFIGEDTPVMTGPVEPGLPSGHDYDYINAEVLLTRASVKDGRLVLPDGKDYRFLALPHGDTMRPEVLEKIAGFVDAGLPVFGTLPTRSPSLENFPACDERVRALAKKLEGRILPETGLAEALKKAPAFDSKGAFVHTQRRSSEADVFFVANLYGKNDPRTAVCAFRTTRPVAEFWHPDLGKIEPVKSEVGDGVMRVSVTLPEHGSVFVVFREKATGGAAKVPEKAPGELPVVLTVAGPWSVEFDPAGGGAKKSVEFKELTDWTTQAEPWIKYFSGTATYKTKFEIASSQSQPNLLDLGAVGAMAEVTLNGKTYPMLWIAPYRLDVTGALKPGVNQLQVRVVNAWHNRLLGKKREETAAGSPEPWLSNWKVRVLKHDETLHPSGLLGPVRVMTME